MAHCRFKTGNGTFLKDIIEVGSINFVHKRIHKNDTALFYHIIHKMKQLLIIIWYITKQFILEKCEPLLHMQQYGVCSMLTPNLNCIHQTFLCDNRDKQVYHISITTAYDKDPRCLAFPSYRSCYTLLTDDLEYKSCLDIQQSVLQFLLNVVVEYL